MSNTPTSSVTAPMEDVVSKPNPPVVGFVVLVVCTVLGMIIYLFTKKPTNPTAPVVTDPVPLQNVAPTCTPCQQPAPCPKADPCPDPPPCPKAPACPACPPCPTREPLGVGCYKDANDRAMQVLGTKASSIYYGADQTLLPSLGDYRTYENCKSTAKLYGYKYFALQDGYPQGGNGKAPGTAVCFVSNDLNQATSKGASDQCNRWNSDGKSLGGAWANYIYQF